MKQVYEVLEEKFYMICVLCVLRLMRPTFWNSLPDHLSDPAVVDTEQFRRDLKMFPGHSKH